MNFYSLEGSMQVRGRLGGRALLVLAAVLAVGLSGCEDNGADNGGGGGNNNSGGGALSCGNRECASAAMPDGKTWMTENLNKTTADSWCYDNSTANCDKYGRLYTWEAAKKACPSGWHLPTRDEWGALAKAAGGGGDYGEYGVAGTALKSTSGWIDNAYIDGGNGTNDFGFSALPSGFRNYYGGDFYHAGEEGFWWTATENGNDYAYYRHIGHSTGSVYEGNHYIKSSWLSVRCVQ
jgi:uncharacterized protein (TIGR02145 family)